LIVQAPRNETLQFCSESALRGAAALRWDMVKQTMDIQAAIRAVVEYRDLTRAEMESVMRLIMTGQATQAQIGGFLVGLRMKGESVDEIAAAALVMRELATRVEAGGQFLVDTCGTGGDASGTFNISTASAFVAAAAGARVAKHGNRSVSSRSGSADVLEEAGVRLDLGPEQVRQCIDRVGVGFLFAPLHHGAMKYAVGPRAEMGIRTLFNLLGPLTNPAGAPNQLLGVFSDAWLEPLARVLQQLGSDHVLVVHARDGLDEISVGADTLVAELKDGAVTSYSITPEQYGIQRTDISALCVANATESLAMVRAVLDDTAGPARDIVILNAGAAIYVSGIAFDLADGVSRAREAISSGVAAEKLDELISVSNEV
jgi:anthranilate phosphoribosyltransferase